MDEEYPEDPDDEMLGVGWMMVDIDSLVSFYYECFHNRYYNWYKRPADLA